MRRSPDEISWRRYSSALSGVPMASSIASARDGAPPWSGPARAPIAPVSADPMSDPVEVITRAVNVDELNPWSMVRIRYCSSARIARCVRALAGEHLDVGARVAEVRVRLDRLEAEVVAVQAHQQHRDDRRHLQAFPADLLGRDVEGRLLLERRSGERHRRAERHQRRVPGKRGDLREQVGHASRGPSAPRPQAW